MIKTLIRDDSGASLAEYALLLALISVAVIGAITGLRDAVVSQFERAASTLAAGNTPAK